MAPVRILGLAIVLFVAGAVVLLAADGTTAKAVGYALVGLAGVAGVSAAFYAVGLSEDRARAREEERRRGQPPTP
jgi:hypothetical protein